MLGTITNKIFGGLAIAGIIISATLFNLYIDSQESLALEERKTQALALTIESISKNSAKLDQLAIERNNELRAVEKELASMSGRGATLVAKPKLVEKLIQQAVKEREERLECITGGICSEKP